MLAGKAIDVHEKLWEAWTELSWSIDNYKDMFANVEARKTIDPFGGEVFAMYLWRRLWNDLILQLTRLTDPPKRGRNISLKRLESFCGSNHGLRADIKKAIAKAERATQSARVLRNKTITHFDEKSSLAKASLGPQSLGEIETATEMIYQVLHRFDMSVLQRHTVNKVQHPHYGQGLVDNLETAGYAVRYIAEFLTDTEDPERFTHEAMKPLVECLGREFDPHADGRRLLDIWTLGQRITPLRRRDEGRGRR